MAQESGLLLLPTLFTALLPLRFGTDALGYFSIRVDPSEVILVGAVTTIIAGAHLLILRIVVARDGTFRGQSDKLVRSVIVRASYV